MKLILYLLIILVGSVGLCKSASLVIATILKLARHLHISDFTLGFFVLGLATSIPELFVGINSALADTSQLSLGNLLGGIIVLLTLIIGSTAVILGRVSFKEAFSPKEMLLTSFVIITPAFLILDGQLSRLDGLWLLVFYVIFFFLMNKKETLLEHVRDELIQEPLVFAKLMGKFSLGLAGLIVFSKIIVEAALPFANQLNVPLFLVGLLMLSLSTNLPEVTLAFFSRKQHRELAMGNFLGSAAANIPILGLVAFLSPIEIMNLKKVQISLVLLILAVGAFALFARSQKVISRGEGFILLGIYLSFLLTETFWNP